MRNVLNPFEFVLSAVAGWMNQKQQHAIEYLREENRVLREQLERTFSGHNREEVLSAFA
jgi:cell shape-determining protein MreC